MQPIIRLDMITWKPLSYRWTSEILQMFKVHGAKKMKLFKAKKAKIQPLGIKWKIVFSDSICLHTLKNVWFQTNTSNGPGEKIRSIWTFPPRIREEDMGFLGPLNKIYLPLHPYSKFVIKLSWFMNDIGPKGMVLWISLEFLSSFCLSTSCIS